MEQPGPAETRTMPEPQEASSLPTPGPLLVVVSGPSGVGKDTLLDRLKQRGARRHFVVTSTTRPPRPGEVDGVDYLFVSVERFQEMMAAGDLLEWAKVYSDYKGVPKQSVGAGLEQGLDVIMRTDVQGAASIRRLVPEALLIFLAPASMEELEQRLRRRSTESPHELALRLEAARQEMAQMGNFDYLVINREGALDEAVATVEAIVCAERCRTHPRQVRLP